MTFISNYICICFFQNNLFFYIRNAIIVPTKLSISKIEFIFEFPNLSGRYPGVGTSNPLQYSCLGNPMDRGVWRATVHGVAKSPTRLEWMHTDTHTHTHTHTSCLKKCLFVIKCSNWEARILCTLHLLYVTLFNFQIWNNFSYLNIADYSKLQNSIYPPSFNV